MLSEHSPGRWSCQNKSCWVVGFGFLKVVFSFDPKEALRGSACTAQLIPGSFPCSGMGFLPFLTMWKKRVIKRQNLGWSLLKTKAKIHLGGTSMLYKFPKKHAEFRKFRKKLCQVWWYCFCLGQEVLYNNRELQLRRPRRGCSSKRQDGEEGSNRTVSRGRKTGAETERKSVGCISAGSWGPRSLQLGLRQTKLILQHWWEEAPLQWNLNLPRLTSLWFVLILQLLSVEKERCVKQIENIQNISFHV